GINLKIELKKALDSKNLPLPFGLLYNIFRKKFLVLKKILWDLINKGFIRVNNSTARIPVLFI
ncbi:hypothetical protein NEUTE2DRAFT_60300, partial [Neurospora tetrasperma FGSC 2509]